MEVKKSFLRNIAIVAASVCLLLIVGFVLETYSSDLPTGLSVANSKGSSPLSGWSIIMLALGVAVVLAFRNRSVNVKSEDKSEKLDSLFADAWMHFNLRDYDGMQTTINEINNIYADLSGDLKAETYDRILKFYEEIKR